MKKILWFFLGLVLLTACNENTDIYQIESKKTLSQTDQEDSFYFSKYQVNMNLKAYNEIIHTKDDQIIYPFEMYHEGREGIDFGFKSLDLKTGSIDLLWMDEMPADDYFRSELGPDGLKTFRYQKEGENILASKIHIDKKNNHFLFKEDGSYEVLSDDSMIPLIDQEGLSIYHEQDPLEADELTWVYVIDGEVKKDYEGHFVLRVPNKRNHKFSVIKNEDGIKERIEEVLSHSSGFSYLTSFNDGSFLLSHVQNRQSKDKDSPFGDHKYSLVKVHPNKEREILHETDYIMAASFDQSVNYQKDTVMISTLDNRLFEFDSDGNLLSESRSLVSSTVGSSNDSYYLGSNEDHHFYLVGIMLDYKNPGLYNQKLGLVKMPRNSENVEDAELLDINDNAHLSGGAGFNLFVDEEGNISEKRRHH